MILGCGLLRFGLQLRINANIDLRSFDTLFRHVTMAVAATIVYTIAAIKASGIGLRWGKSTAVKRGAEEQ